MSNDTMQAQQGRPISRHIPRAMRLERRSLILLLVAGGLMTLLILGVYLRPVTIVHDVGTRPETMSGVYPPEQNPQFSYAYTNGDATLRLPLLGHGRTSIALRMSGPNEQIALPAMLRVNDWPIDLGAVQQLRTYRVLVPADARGAVTVQVLSARTTIGTDPRDLGVLLDRIVARSVGAAWPPVALLISMLALASLVAATAHWYAPPFAQRLGLLLGASVLLPVLCLAGRGRIDLLTWWSMLLLCGTLALFLQLSKAGARAFARPVLAVAALFLTWRVALWLFAALGLHYAALFANTPLAIAHHQYDMSGPLWQQALVGGWARWDSTNYLAIADSGYTFAGQRWPSIAFFPLYPLLIRAVTTLTGLSSILAALVIAQAAFFAALLILYHLLAADFGSSIAFRSLLLLLVCPSSFFFAAVYSEAVALLLLVAAVWALRHQRWWLAGLAGLLLALARLPGVLIAPILVIAYLQACNWNWRALRWPVAAALLPPLGLALFMLYQWRQFGTPFAFMIAQRMWHNHLSPPWVLPQALYDYIFVYDLSPTAVFQSVFWIAFLVLTLAALRRLPLLYSMTLLLVLLPPYLSSWPWSVSRHVLLGFPAFVVLACWTTHLRVRQPLIVALFVLLGAATMLFVNGFLVA